MHITDEDKIDVIILLNIANYDLCKKMFWCFAYVGKNGSKQEAIYTHINRKKVFLNRVLLNISDDVSDIKIIFMNRNCLDFRIENLRLCEKNEKYFKNIPKTGKKLPSGVFEVKQKNNNVTGYNIVTNSGFEYFGVKKFKTLEKCLIAAMDKLDEMKNKNNLKF